LCHAQNTRDGPSRIQRAQVPDETSQARDWPDNSSDDVAEKANQWLNSYKGLLNQWTEPQRTARKDVPNLEEDIVPRSPALFHDFVSKRVSAPWSSTTNAMTTIKSPPGSETTESLSSVVSNQWKDSSVHESMNENSEMLAPTKRQVLPMENRNHPQFDQTLNDSGVFEPKSLSGNGKPSSLFSSFIGSFFPGFNIPKSETRSSVNIGSTHSTKPYATVSRNTDVGASTVVPTSPSNGHKVKKMDFFRERSESFSPFPTHKGNDDAPSVFFGAKTPSFSSLAVSSGYAQVIKQNDQMNMEKKNLNKRQPEVVAEAKAEPLARPPLSAMASRPIMDMHNDFKMEQDDKTFLSFQGEAAGQQHEPSYDIRKRIGSAFIDGSSSMDMPSFDSPDNEGSTTTTRAEFMAPTPDLESFCQDAAETTLELHDRSEGKSQLYEKLWELVRVYHIPVSRRDNLEDSNKQMIILLEALCGQMDEHNFGGEAATSKFGSNDEERDFVVSGGFSFGPENLKPNLNLRGKLKPGKVEDVPVDRRRGGNGFRRNLRRNRPPFPGRERPSRRQPPNKRPFPRRAKPVPGDRRSSTAPSTFPFPSGEEHQNEFFLGQFNEKPPFPRVNGPYPSLVPRKDPDGPGYFPGKLQHPSPPFTPRPRTNPANPALPLPAPEVRREYWPPRPNLPREQKIAFNKAQSPYKNQIRMKNLARPRPTSLLHQVGAQGQEFPSTRRPLRQIITTKPPRREYTLFSQNDAFASTETNFDSNLFEASQVPPQRVPFVNSEQHASSKLSNLVDVDDQDGSPPWGSQAIPNGNENDLATKTNGDEINNGISTSSSVDDVHYVYNVTFFTPTVPDETNHVDNQTTNTGVIETLPTVEDITDNPESELKEFTYKGREGENDDAYYYYEDENEDQEVDHEADDMVNQSPAISAKTPRRETQWPRAAISTPNPGFAYPGFDLHAPRTHMISTSTFAPLPHTTTQSYFPVAVPQNPVDFNEQSHQPTPPQRRKPLINMTFGTHAPALQGQFEGSKANSHPQRLEVEVKQTPNRHQTQQLEIEEVFSHNQGDSTESGVPTTKTIFLDEVEVDRSKLKGGNLPNLAKDKKQTNLITESQDPSAFESKFNSGSVYDPFVPANKRRSTLPPTTLAPSTPQPIIVTSTSTQPTRSIPSPIEEEKIESNELYEYEYVYDGVEESLPSPIIPLDIEEYALEDYPLPLAEVSPEEAVALIEEEKLPSSEISPITLLQSITSPNNGSENSSSSVESEEISTGFPPKENVENTSMPTEAPEISPVEKDGVSSLEHLANNDQREMNDDIKSFPDSLQSDHEHLDPISQEYQYYYEDVNNLSEEQKAKYDVVLPLKEDPPTLLGLDIPQAVLDSVGESKEDYDSLYNDVETLLPNSASSMSNGFHTTTSSLTRNDRFAKNGLPSENDLESAPFAILRKSQEQEVENAMNPEKLAYILIGVCCGLSILCLIVVAISIGYKSETHYRLDDGRRKRHIKLLRASPGNDEGESVTSSGHNNYADSVDEATTSSEDLSGMKLGPWFNGKHHIQTLDRKSNMVFPTSVYLENLESGTEGGESEGKRDREAGEGNLAPKNALSVNTVKDLEANLEPENHSPTNETGSLSSFDTLRADPNLLRDPEPGFPLPNAVHSSRNNLSTSSSVRANFKKHSSYAIGSNRFTQGTFNLNKAGRRMGSISKTKGSSISETENGLTTSTGSFRFLVEDDSVSENSSQAGGPINRPDKSGSFSGGGVEGDTNREFGEIHWSSNVDRLI
ncbi:hypothetical protein TCAL_16440, partial [Tigriopus californicus]